MKCHNSACGFLMASMAAQAIRKTKFFLGKQNFIFRLNNINIYHKYQ